MPESKDNNPMASFPANFLNSNIDRVSAYLDVIVDGLSGPSNTATPRFGEGGCIAFVANSGKLNA